MALTFSNIGRFLSLSPLWPRYSTEFTKNLHFSFALILTVYLWSLSKASSILVVTLIQSPLIIKISSIQQKTFFISDNIRSIKLWNITGAEERPYVNREYRNNLKWVVIVKNCTQSECTFSCWYALYKSKTALILNPAKPANMSSSIGNGYWSTLMTLFTFVQKSVHIRRCSVFFGTTIVCDAQLE